MHRRHLLILDFGVPIVVGAAILAGLLLHGTRAADPLSVALGLTAAATLWARRRAPVTVLAASGAMVAGLFAIDTAAAPIAVLAPAVALYSLALNRGRVVQLFAGVSAVAAVIAAELISARHLTVLEAAAHVLLVAVPLLAAEAIRTHRSYLTVLLERVELAQRTREQEADRRAEQERLRIARELHDVVAHTLTEINVRAAAAAESTPPSSSHDALEAIETASRDAIGELRAIVGVLRDRDQQAVPLTPAPTIEDIRQLTQRASENGLQVRLDTSGRQPARFSHASSLATYRIVQESLTNARRHGSSPVVQLTLTYGPDDITINVENDADGAPTVDGGVGLLGMRERALALGGQFSAKRSPGRFRVSARLPYEPRR